jgi:FMN phosphatase YigB (HAD superfamily)
MSKESLTKRAALAIRTLNRENKNLENRIEELSGQLHKTAKVHELSLRFMKIGAYPVEDFEEQYNKFQEKSYEELETFEKAAELISDPKFSFELGTLSDEPAEGGGSPESRFIRNILNEF